MADDHAAVLALNNAAIPHVNALTAEQLAWLADRADYLRVAMDDGQVAGFILAVPPDVDYWSLNYRWFSDRHSAFLYLDRVVVAASARRRGIGRRLYEDIFDFVRDRWPRIVLEVNLRPPNPESQAFHVAMGFRKSGVREEPRSEKAVVMMER